MIRAFSLLDSSNRCIFHWAGSTSIRSGWFEKMRMELSAGQPPKPIMDFVRAVSLGNENEGRVELEGYSLTLCFHRGFLIVADVESWDNYRKTMPTLLAEMDRVISEDPLSLGELLSGIDTPGRSKMINRISAILEYQETSIGTTR